MLPVGSQTRQLSGKEELVAITYFVDLDISNSEYVDCAWLLGLFLAGLASLSLKDSETFQVLLQSAYQNTG